MRKLSRHLTRSIIATVAAAALGLGLAMGSPSDGTSEHGHTVDKRLVLTEDSINFGAYDPHGDFASESRASVEHVFMPWEDVDLSDLRRADAYALERGRMLLITVEPWSWSPDFRVSSAELLAGILDGRYDSNITDVCSAASELKSPVSIRWGHEMEDSKGYFPWAQWSPKDFIAAYQHFVTECRKHLPDGKYVWSPKGNNALADFYPGDQYVDVVGLSVFGYQPYDKINFGGERTFAQALEPGYRLVEGFGKPVIVAELGYEGDQDYVTRWAKAIATPQSEFPQLTAVIYFNTRETYPWPLNMGRPNWRIGSPAAVSLWVVESDTQTARQPDCEAHSDTKWKITTTFSSGQLCD
jgi:beta-mannanase